MEVANSDVIGGSLQISTEVIQKIATLSTLEIDGVKQVSCGATAMKNLLGKIIAPQRPVQVSLSDDVAEITVYVIVEYGCKIPVLCEKIQESIKSSVQNMTSITVSKVNVVVAGIQQESATQQD